VLLSGESGVGKSRLVGQLRYEAQLRGGSFALGQCYEDSASAFHPFVQILRQVVPQVSEDETLAPLLSVAADALPLSAAGHVDREREHRRIVDAAAPALLAAAASRPLALCVEDIQWADTASLDLIEHLARNAASTPRLVLAVTYRAEEAESGPLAGALVRLQHAADWDRIGLSRLRRDDVARSCAHARPR
jgi:predicted ATPase